MESLPTGTHLYGAQFAIREVLGHGGGGITYRADDSKLARSVAIKEFFPVNVQRVGLDVLPNAGAVDTFTQGKVAFLEEARALARFQHPNIVDVYSVFEENNTAYMVMEFIEGPSLLKLVEEKGALTEEKALRYIQTTGEAIGAMHEAGILHRDIKPGNILLGTGERVVLIDFGLTKKLTTGQQFETVLFTGDMRAGTAGYSPPEQYSRSAKLTPATDVYALAATAYHLMTAHAPTEAIERAAGVKLALADTLNPKVSSHVATALSRALNLEASARPQSVTEFLQQPKTTEKKVPTRFVFDTEATDDLFEETSPTVRSPEANAGQILVYMVFAIIAIMIVFAFEFVRVALKP